MIMDGLVFGNLWWMIFWLRKRAGITKCRDENEIIFLSDRRDSLDTLFLRKIEASLYNIQLNEYIKFALVTHDTRSKILSHQHRTNVWRFSFYNRIKNQVKIYFPPTDNQTNNTHWYAQILIYIIYITFGLRQSDWWYINTRIYSFYHFITLILCQQLYFDSLYSELS